MNITDRRNIQPFTFQRLPRKLFRTWTFSSRQLEIAKSINEARRRESALLYRLLLHRRVRFSSVTIARERDSLSYPPFLCFIHRGETRAIVNSPRRRRERCARLRAFEMPALTFRRPAGTRGSLFRGVSRYRALRVRPSVRSSAFYRVATCVTLETSSSCILDARVCTYVNVRVCVRGAEVFQISALRGLR